MSIWQNIFCVITSPKYGWEVINESNIPEGKVMRTAYVPLLCVLGLSCFVPMIYDKTIPFAKSLMTGIVMVSTYFISYFIIIYLNKFSNDKINHSYSFPYNSFLKIYCSLQNHFFQVCTY